MCALAGARLFRFHSTLEEFRRNAEQAVNNLRAKQKADPGSTSRQKAAARRRAVEKREQWVRAALEVTAELQAQQQAKARQQAERAVKEAERAETQA